MKLHKQHAHAKHVHTRYLQHTGRPLILPFKRIRHTDLVLVGGKNASLGEMIARTAVPIPDGFSITSEAYKYFICYSNLEKLIRETLKRTNIKKIRELRASGAKIRHAIRTAPMPADLEQEIMKSFRRLGAERVAVRSSATAEDLPSVSENEHVLVKIDGEPFYDEIGELYDRMSSAKSLEVPAMSNNKISWRKAGIYRHPAKGSKLYKIKTRTGREIVISKNHSLLVLDPDTMSPVVTSLDDLKGSERVPCVKKLPNFKTGLRHINVLDYIDGDDVVVADGEVKIKNKSSNWLIQHGLPLRVPITEDLLYFLGIYLAEGSTYKNNGILVTNSDVSVQNRTIKFLRTLGLYDNQKINKNSIRVYCKSLVKLLHAMCGVPLPIRGKGRSCRIKKVPNFVFGLERKMIGAFLRGCFDGDSYVGKGSIVFTTLSRNLLGGVVKLLEIVGIKCYIQNGRDVYVPASEAEMFSEMIGFTEKNKAEKLKKLISTYHNLPKHHDFIDVLPPSKKISELLQKLLKPALDLRQVSVALCPHCGSEMRKYGTICKLQRYYCSSCKKYSSESETRKLDRALATKHVYYDELGRIEKGSIPWNKGNRRPQTYGISHIRRLAQNMKSEELLALTESDILWDEIVTIEPVEYSGHVYDFVVPDVENFVSGLGGIITHNSSSFAGQQESYLNVSEKDLIRKVRDCFASLFTDRAISYREDRHFDHFRVWLSVGVQKMVRSAVSGVIFTLDPDTGHRDFVFINGSWGLGDYVVQGRVDPDQWLVHKPTRAIVSRRIANKKIMEVRRPWGVAQASVPKHLRDRAVLSDAEIQKLTAWSLAIEKMYGVPQDIEWAKDLDGSLYILQSRPETVHAPKHKMVYTEYQLKQRGKLLGSGLAIGRAVAAGAVNVIRNAGEISRFKPGQILVTHATDPDWEPIMKIAAGIITEVGGKTSHAAIVSREMRVPAIVGLTDATRLLRSGKQVTIDCTEETGKVWQGRLKYIVKEHSVSKIPKTKTKLYVNIGTPEIVLHAAQLPVDGVGLARQEFIINSYIGEHPLAMIAQRRGQEYVDKLAEGIAKIAAAFWPRPVVVRLSDFKTSEYRGLKGGAAYEPAEDNPMLGWRGASRYINPKFAPAFRLECKALKKVREDFKNVIIMVPFCRTVEEGRAVLRIMAKEGLKRGRNGLKVYVMAEIPTNCLMADEFCKLFDGFSIGSNDLTQLTMGIDRNSEIVARSFDERNPAVKHLIHHLIGRAHAHGRTVGICGEAPSNYPDFAAWLVREKIDSISVEADAAIKTRFVVRNAEHSHKIVRSR